MKLKDKIARLHAGHPHRSKYGQLYKTLKETKGRFQSVNLWCLFRSDEDTHMFYPHTFEAKSAPRIAKGWSDWFAKHLTKIHTESILPGMAIRTGKRWQVQRIAGFTRYDVPERVRTAVASRQTASKRKGRKNG